MFYRNSSALASLCQSTGNFHQKPTDFLASHLMPFGKTGLLGPPPGDSSGTTTSNSWPPAATQLGGRVEVCRRQLRVLQGDPEGKPGRPARSGGSWLLRFRYQKMERGEQLRFQFKHFQALNLPMTSKCSLEEMSSKPAGITTRVSIV